MIAASERSVVLADGDRYWQNIARTIVEWGFRRRSKQLRRLIDQMNLTWVEDWKDAQRMEEEIRESEYQIALIKHARKQNRALEERAIKRALRGSERW